MQNPIFTHSFIAVCRAQYFENVKSVIEDHNFKLDTRLGFVEQFVETESTKKQTGDVLTRTSNISTPL